MGKEGSKYTVTALSNQTYIFDHWDNGSTLPARNVTLDSSIILRTHYRTPSTPSMDSRIVVNALTEGGGQLQMWTSIATEGTEVKVGATPVVYLGQGGKTYTITASSFQNLVFDHWEGGTKDPVRTINLSGGNNSAYYLTAYYHVVETPVPGLVNLTVDSYTLDGTEIRGLWSSSTTTTAAAPGAVATTTGAFTPATFTVAAGTTYTVAAQDSGNYVFDHWADSSTGGSTTDRVRTVTPFSDTTLTAIYRTPPANLTIVAFDATNNNKVLNGMFTTVVPINSPKMQAGFTNNTYTGYLGSAYRVTASDYLGIVFDHWEDGSKDRIRTLAIDKPTTITAYYRTG